jgi:hypothetical protein
VTPEHESGHERPVQECHAQTHPEPVHGYGVPRAGAPIHKDRLDLPQVGEEVTPDMGRFLDEYRDARQAGDHPRCDRRGRAQRNGHGRGGGVRLLRSVRRASNRPTRRACRRFTRAALVWRLLANVGIQNIVSSEEPTELVTARLSRKAPENAQGRVLGALGG